jgi:hypothetical protein
VSVKPGLAHSDPIFPDPIFPPFSRDPIFPLEKLGFEKEGALREWAHFKGSFRDVYCYSLLKKEWKA